MLGDPGGERGGLGTPAHAQLGQEVGDVVLDRLLGEEQLRSDLPVGLAVGDQGQDLPLSVGQLVDVVGVGLVASDAVDDPACRGRVDERPSVRHGANGADQLVAVDLLEQVPRRAGQDGLGQRLLVGERREHETGHVGLGGADLAADLHTVAVGEAYIEDGDVGADELGDGRGVDRRPRVADDLDVVLGFQQLAKALPHHLVVVEQEHADAHGQCPPSFRRAPGDDPAVPAWEDALVPYRSVADPAQLRALLGVVVRVHGAVEVPAVLRRVAEGARSLAGAQYAAAGVVDSSGQAIDIVETVGSDPERPDAAGRDRRSASLLESVLRDPRPLRLDDVCAQGPNVGAAPWDLPRRSLVVVPLLHDGAVRGALFAAEKLDGAFTDDDERVLEALAATTVGAIEHSRLLEQVRDLTVVADRERIARDLHDTVIQRLFAVGLELQSVQPLVPGDAGEVVDAAVTELDGIIREVRTVVFALEPAPQHPVGLRGRVNEVCAEAGTILGFAPELTVSGPLDRSVPEDVAAELLAAVREGLANVAHHADAEHCSVVVVVDDELTLRIVDDGRGLGDPTRRAPGHGLADMAARAEVFGGWFSTTPAPGGGTAVTWSVPLAPVRR